MLQKKRGISSPFRNSRLTDSLICMNLISFMLVIVYTTAASVCVAEPTWQIFQLTDGNVIDLAPAVSGTTYVWRRGSGNFSEIYLWTEGDAAPTLISVDTQEGVPRISGDRVLWESNAQSDYEINEWKIGLVTQLTNNTENDRFPDVGGTGAVWKVNSWFLLHDNGIQQTEITSGFAGSARLPRVVDNVVVWDASSTGSTNDGEIYHWRNGVLNQLTNNNNNDALPETDGTTVVWQSSIGPSGTDEIMRWTTANGITQLTQNNSFDAQPDVSGDLVVFTRDDGQDFEIFLYHFGLEYQITDNDIDDFEPAIDGDRIVWQANVASGVRHIYYAILSGFVGGDPPGACCIGLRCSRLTKTDCGLQGGTFGGPETLCRIDSCPQAVAPATTWSTFQHDAQRTGRTSAVAPDSPTRIWSLHIGSSSDLDVRSTSPVVRSDGTILVGSESSFSGIGSHLVAINSDSSLQWEHRYNSVVVASPTIRADGYAFLPLHDRISKIDPFTGLGVCDVLGGNVSPAMDNAGNIYYTSGQVVSKANAGCEIQWSFLLPQTAAAPLAIGHDGGIYAVSDFALVKINSTTGLEEWRINTPGQTGGVAIGDDDTIYLQYVPDVLMALQPDGLAKWTFTVPDIRNAQPPSSPAVAADGNVYVISNTLSTNQPILVGVAIICGIRLQSGSTMCPTGRILVGPRGS